MTLSRSKEYLEETQGSFSSYMSLDALETSAKKELPRLHRPVSWGYLLDCTPLWMVPALVTWIWVIQEKWVSEPRGARQEAAFLHGLCLSSCLGDPAWSSHHGFHGDRTQPASQTNLFLQCFLTAATPGNHPYEGSPLYF